MPSKKPSRKTARQSRKPVSDREKLGPYTDRLTITLRVDQISWLRAHSKETGVPIAESIRRLIDNYRGSTGTDSIGSQRKTVGKLTDRSSQNR